MIYIQTNLKIIDNTGVKNAKCVKIYKKFIGTVGDTILISIKKIRSKNKLKTTFVKGGLFKALIIRTKFSKLNFLNNYLSFDQNSIIILNQNNQPMGTRLVGPLPLNFRHFKQFKILSMSSVII